MKSNATLLVAAAVLVASMAWAARPSSASRSVVDDRAPSGTRTATRPLPRAAVARIAAGTRQPTADAPSTVTHVAPSQPAMLLTMTCDSPTQLPAGIDRVANIAYGSDPRQRFDVYLPTAPATAPRPVLVMVHGGGWADGDKAMPNVVMNKAAYWVPKGWIFVSVNYRMLPDTLPLDQARDVARAVARAQQLAPLWNGDPSRFVLMGHSAGAHLVSLLNADTTLAAEQGAQPWRATVALDSAAYDVPRIMRAPHPPLYDDAFGSDPAQWPVPSPIDRLHAGGAPMLGICSSLRDDSCPQATDFASRTAAVGTAMRVAPEALSHEQINECLGLPSDYTQLVDAVVSNAVLPSGTR